MSWVQTYKNHRFDYLAENPPIDIEDIAHALSNIGRWNGHTKTFWSVGAHSLIVSFLTEHMWVGSSSGLTRNQLALAGLLHDASEAYFCDVPRPLKRLVAMEKYAELEEKMHGKIFKAFNLPITEVPVTVKWADNYMLQYEYKRLFDAHLDWAREEPREDLENVCDAWFKILNGGSHKFVEECFLKRFWDLTGADTAEFMMGL